MNRRRTTIVFVIGLALALGWSFPANAAPLYQTAAPSIELLPNTAAPGTQIIVRGVNFTRATAGSILFYWDSISSYAIGNAASVSNYSFTDTATIPPNATPGLHTLIAYDNNSKTQATAGLTVVGDTKRGLYIYGTDAAAAKNYQTLMLGRGMLDLDVTSLGKLSEVDPSNYDLLIAGADTGLWDTQEIYAQIVRLLRSHKPVLALGSGGFELLRRMNLQNGKLKRMDTSRSGIVTRELSNPIFQSPYRFTSGSISLYSASSPLVAMYFSDPVHHVVQLGDVADSSGYSTLISQERRFLLWGFSADPRTLSDDGQKLMVNAIWQLLLYNPYADTLILCDFDRMTSLGYSATDVDNLRTKIDALAALPSTQSNMIAVVRQLNLHGTVALHTARTNWIYEGVGSAGINSVSTTNAYVNAIDQYIEQLKQSTYPELKYVIFVGSHEVIPMKARDTDDMESHKESNWAGGLPQTSGYFYSLYHDLGAYGYGHYLTDSIYGDLSYVNNGYGDDDELIPELGVGRLVETPNQISALLDHYMASSAHLASGSRASIASNDYMDGGQAAADILGTATDTSLIQTTFDTNQVPTVMNAHNAIVYLAGHGNYNYIAPGFLAGASGSNGDTEELTMLPNSVVVTSGCHNGVNFGNLRYHDYTGNTTYGEFPERMANGDVGIYLGATGYTWITGTGSSTNPNSIGVNEKLSVYFLKHLLKDGSSSTPGKAYKAAVNEYLGAAPDFAHYTRRVLAIATLYGIPNYRPPQLMVSQLAQQVFGYSLLWKSLQTTAVQTAESLATQDITLQINNWSVNPDGLVQIPGADYSSGGDVPILPVIKASRLFPPGTLISDVAWDEAASESTTITNDVPLFQMSVNGEVVSNPFSSSVFYPASPYSSGQTSTLGDGGVNLTLSIYPVQYNSSSHQTRIWTKLVFHVTFAVETLSAEADSDADGLPDYWETAYGMRPNEETGENGATGDLDADGLTNEQEYAAGTEPSNSDSDHDGVLDGQEMAEGTDPLNPGSREFDIYLSQIKK